MRSTGFRLTATLTVAVLTLAFTGCGSNNTGKIVGKWKVVSSTKPNEDMNQLKQVGVTMAFEFRADNSFTVNFVPDREGHGAKVAADMANQGLQGKDVSGTYKLGAGNRVTFSGATFMFKGKNAVADITINGDSMTLKDGPDSLQLTRVP